jgi:uncharacterized membrane protein YphA (DoxX/SURF4 family)
MKTTKTTFSNLFEFLGFFLRVLIGWHFLYEGVTKIFDSGWTSAGYLMQSNGILSTLFHRIAENPALLKLVDLLNVGGLVFVGLGLLLGLLTRASCITGSLMLLLYFLAGSGQSLEGHYLFIDKNLIEMAALLLLASLPSKTLPGLDRLLSHWNGPKTQESIPGKARIPRMENHLHTLFVPGFSRRELVKNLSVLPVLGGFVFASARRHGWNSHEETNLVDAASGATIRTAGAASLDDLRAPAPKGQIGSLKISRLICGGNLISGFAHARDLIYVSPLLKSYFTDEKVMETLWLCESSGINTAILRTDSDTIRILNKYWKKGGKIQWIAQTYPSEKDLTGNIQMALDSGAVGAFVQGNLADSFLRGNRKDIIEKSVEFIRSRGAIAGTAAHNLNVIQAIEESGLDVDFYMKTVHKNDYWSSRRPGQDAEVIDNSEDNYWDMDPAETIRFMEGVTKPWIAYKILAAGAIPPEEGFRYVFENGADFACVGMFDFQVVNNVNTLAQVLDGDLRRTRTWKA